MKTIKRLLPKLVLSVILLSLICACAFSVGGNNVYAASDPKLTVRYVDEDGKSLALNEVITTKNGYYTLSIKVITGYTYKESSMPIVGEITEDSTIDMVYKENVLKLVVRFLDEEGNKIQDPKVYPTTLRTLLTLDLREIGQIEGYTYTGESQIIDVEIVGGATLDLVYRKANDAETGGGCNSRVEPYYLGGLLIAAAIVPVAKKIKNKEGEK